MPLRVSCPAPLLRLACLGWGRSGPGSPLLGWGCGGGGRASPGGVPSTVARGVWGQALPLPGLPAHWAGCWGPRSTCCWRGRAGVGALVCPLGLHALWGLRAVGRVRDVRVPGCGLGGGGLAPYPPFVRPGGPVGRGVALPRSVPLPALGRQQSGCHWRRAVHGGRGPPYDSGSCSPAFSGRDLCGALPQRGDQRRTTPTKRPPTPGGAPPNTHRRSKDRTPYGSHQRTPTSHRRPQGNGGHTYTGRTCHTHRGSRRERRRTAHHHALTARRQPRPPQGPPHRHRKRTKARPQRPGLGTETPRGHGTKAQAPREGNPTYAYPTNQPERHAQAPTARTKRDTHT